MGNLNPFIAELERIARAAKQIAPRVAVAIRGEIEREFATGTDPNGNAWAALAARTLKRHGPPPLTDTGTMRSTVECKAEDGDVRIKIEGAASQASYHQGGYTNALTGRFVPARPMLPVDGSIPASWATIVQREFDIATGRAA